ncbi:MAG TPA: ABC transporter permease [Vicinamibacteria bacterium]|nr:ABC transporter permease [Vicinamibacteria bacterium]
MASELQRQLNMTGLWQDIRFGARSLLRNHGLSAAVLATLALGIALSTSLFSVVNGVLLRPLPYPDSAGLVQVWETRPQLGRERNPVSPADFFDWASLNEVFESMAAYVPRSVGVSGEGEPIQVEGAAVSADFFRVLGAPAAYGRLFDERDDEPGAPPVVVLDDGIFRRLFGSDSSAVGRTLVVDGIPRRVVGVLSPSLSFPRSATELWIPLGLDRAERQVRALHTLRVIARLRPGVSLLEAGERMEALAATLEKEHAVNRGHGASVRSLKDELVGDVRPALRILSVAVALLLIVACTNVANLLLARATGRSREMALRVSLGARRTRLVRQLLTESLLLALGGGLMGTLLAVWSIDALRGLPPTVLPRAGEIGLDGAVMAFTLVTSLSSGVFFGIAPALQGSSQAAPMSNLTARGFLPRGRRLRQALVVTQVAVALILATGSALLARSVVRLLDVEPGFHHESLLTAGVSLPEARYPSPESRAIFFRELQDRLSASPDVISAATVTALPLQGPSGGRYFFIVGDPPRPPGQGLNANFNLVSPDYFQTMGIPLLRGRDFTVADGIEASPVAIVNQAMADRFWPGRDPLGARIGVGQEPHRTVVGVVGNVRQSGLDQKPEPEMFWPQLQNPYHLAVIVTRTAGEPLAALPVLRETVRAIDREMVLARISTGEEIVSGSVDSRKLPLGLFTLFAGLTVLLAAVGLGGVLSYAVSLRTRELGLRLALGAERRSVMSLVLRDGLILAGSGIALGAVACVFLAGFLSHLLYGMSPRDPSTLSGVALLLGGVSVLAAYIPARRATKVDPVVALQHE